MIGNNHVKFRSPNSTNWGLLFGALVLGISRNPSLKDELFKMAILGFVRIWLKRFQNGLIQIEFNRSEI